MTPGSRLVEVGRSVVHRVRLFRRRDEHEVTIIQLGEDGPGAFLVMCSCSHGWPVETKEEAFRQARRHGSSVVAEIEDRRGVEGGAGWLCLFCGEVIERAPLRISVHWTDGGVDDEQWYASHRSCFIQHMSKDDLFEPRFAAD